MQSKQNKDRVLNIGIRCPPELRKALKILAAQRETSLQGVCIEALRAFAAKADAA